MLACGLEGIKNGYACPEPVEENVYHMGEDERKKRGIGTLPADLSQAIELAEGSTVLRKCLGEEMTEKLIANKKMEWDAYRTQVTDWELDSYLPLL
jgi:glutamine synthetase